MKALFLGLMFCFLLLPGLVIAQSSQPNPAIFNPNPDSESPPMNTYNPDIYNPNQDTDPAPMNTYNPDVYNPQDYSQPSPSTYNFTQDSSQPSPSIYEPDERYGLVPCGSPGQQPCTTEDVVKFANNLITWLISILGVIAVIALMIVGFKLVTSAGNPSAWAEAKGMFTNIVIGIIIILAAWLVVDTIMKGLTQKGLEQWDGGLEGGGPTERGPLNWHFDGTATGDFHSYQECMNFRERVLKAGESVGPCYES